MQRLFPLCCVSSLLLTFSFVCESLAQSTIQPRKSYQTYNPVIVEKPAQTDSSKEISMDSSGYIRNAGSIVGQIDSSSGYIRDGLGSIIGQIDRSTGYIRDDLGSIIGQIDRSTGYIRDDLGSIIGQYTSDGQVRDANGSYIATVNDRDLVLFLFFFLQ